MFNLAPRSVLRVRHDCWINDCWINDFWIGNKNDIRLEDGSMCQIWRGALFVILPCCCCLSFCLWEHLESSSNWGFSLRGAKKIYRQDHNCWLLWCHGVSDRDVMKRRVWSLVITRLKQIVYTTSTQGCGYGYKRAHAIKPEALQ